MWRLSASLSSADADAVDQRIDDALAEVGRHTHADVVVVAQRSADGSSVEGTHVWHAVEPDSSPDVGKALIHAGWSLGRLARGEVVRVDDTGALPAGADTERTVLGRLGKQAAMAAPLARGGRLAGIVALLASRPMQGWGAATERALRCFGLLVGTALERQGIERALQASESRYRAVVESASDGIFLLQSGRIELANPRLARMVGRTQDELAGLPLADLVSAADAARVLALHGRHMTGELLTLRYETTLLHPDGDRVEVDVNVAPVRDGGRRASLGVVRDVTELKAAERTLRHQASHDPLTDLLNHGHIEERLAAEFSAARRHGNPLSVCLCDLDDFKSVNDTHGHLIGDRVLARFAALMSVELRREDTAGRYGGDEFLVVLPYSAIEAATNVAQRVRRRLSETTFEADDGRTFCISASFGVGEIRDCDLSSTDLFRAADHALLQAKRGGRDQIVQRATV